MVQRPPRLRERSRDQRRHSAAFIETEAAPELDAAVAAAQEQAQVGRVARVRR
ncbi:hypothetical protein ACFSTD_23540 [Novosphingobium colocasiae]